MAPPLSGGPGRSGGPHHKRDKGHGGGAGGRRDKAGSPLPAGAASSGGGGGGDGAGAAGASAAAGAAGGAGFFAAAGGGDDCGVPTREVVRPPNQLRLTDAQLAEELPRMLTANNPDAPSNVARYASKERAYRFEPMVEQLAVHFATDGWLLHKSSDEARRQAEAERAEADAAARAARADQGSGAAASAASAADVNGEPSSSASAAAGDAAAAAGAAADDADAADETRALRNAFNFAERAAQTFTFAPRERGTFTEPPPTANASGSCSLWEIHDGYRRDLERQRADEAAKARGGPRKSLAAGAAASGGGGGGSTSTSGRGGADGGSGAARASVIGGGGSSAAAAGAAAGGWGGAGDGTARSDASSLSGGPSAGGHGLTAAGGGGNSTSSTGNASWAAAPGVLDGLRVLDRMAGQNSFAEVAADFAYWEDASDAFRPGEGSLLPLWAFRCPPELGRKHVTCLAWSAHYGDQFAAGFGSFHYARQGAGGVAVYSLKNPAHAEAVIRTSSGVMALAFHPQYANLLAVGCYDGSVAVYDVRQAAAAAGGGGGGAGAGGGGKAGRGGGGGGGALAAPLYAPAPKAAKHADAVWQVVWQPDELQRSLAFASASSDGDVLLWTLSRSELVPERLTRLHAAAASAAPAVVVPAAAATSVVAADVPDTAAAEAATEAAAAAAAAAAAGPRPRAVGGLCMDFGRAPGQEHLYVVGGEEGALHVCSRAHGSDELARVDAHGGVPVYGVQWSRHRPGLLLSCSADWSVRVWDVERPAAPPLLSFDLGAPVGDAQWAPFSSTVLAAVTDEGRVAVFDLHQSRQVPLCLQRCARSARLTRLAFSPRHPVLLVGDSRGGVTAFKLSPNLRRTAAATAAAAAAAAAAGGGGVGRPPPAAAAASRLSPEEMERAKLDAVVELARKSQVAG